MERAAFIGFGEAGIAFATNIACAVTAYDRKTYSGPTRQAKLTDYRWAGVAGASTNKAAVAGMAIILSLVTADRALAAARETARAIEPGALFLDMNSVSPDTKRQAATSVEAADARYVDVAVMAPVNPKGREVPILVSGPHASAGRDALLALGFADVTVAGDFIGEASAVKMIRSVMVKGIEALSAECLLAAEAAGVRDAVIASLDASWPGANWARRGDYNLDRMIVHGVRRADEMEEVVATLDALGTGSTMTRATVGRQRDIGNRRLASPGGLEAKLIALLKRQAPMERAA